MDEQTVQHVAKLARLQLDAAEVARFAGEMSAITGYIDQLSKVNVEGVEATVHPVCDRNLWREDRAQNSLKREEATANAPDSEQNFFRVPPAIE
ncbi:MAG: Asp-tRNA(Asn)/Glu-tRNA(Gln) amidotransferase subunit GatC [Planctomycetes bacterium]|nr:Asp-tRNA(Asn)/Glu-tRNA(Gln) amidotransferase subunit GatC [Planctomycetota bacterium]